MDVYPRITMTLEEFEKKRFIGYEEIECYPKSFDDYCIPCMLLAVDFEQKLFRLLPIDTEMYEDKPFWARPEYCKRPNPRLKLLKK